MIREGCRTSSGSEDNAPPTGLGNQTWRLLIRPANTSSLPENLPEIPFPREKSHCSDSRCPNSPSLRFLFDTPFQNHL